jgi:hypothetical protein
MNNLQDISDAINKSADKYREERKLRGMYHYAHLFSLSEKGELDLFSIGYKLSRLDAEYNFEHVSHAIKLKVLGSELSVDDKEIIEELRRVSEPNI